MDLKKLQEISDQTGVELVYATTNYKKPETKAGKIAPKNSNISEGELILVSKVPSANELFELANSVNENQNNIDFEKLFNVIEKNQLVGYSTEALLDRNNISKFISVYTEILALYFDGFDAGKKKV